MRLILLVAFSMLCMLKATLAQNDFSQDQLHLAAYLSNITSKSDRLTGDLSEKERILLERMEKQEKKLAKRLYKKDSLASKEIFGDVASRYSQYAAKCRNPSSFTEYIGALDTLSTSLAFLKSGLSEIVVTSSDGQLAEIASSSVGNLRTQFEKSRVLQTLLNERREYLNSTLKRYNLAKQLSSINGEYSAYFKQIETLKSSLSDRRRIEAKAVELITNSDAFKSFMRKNSQLASLLRIPTSPDPTTMDGLAGLQTRSAVDAFIQTKLGADQMSTQQVSANIQQAQDELSRLKDRVMKQGSGSSESLMPENSNTNSQKSKPFLKRLTIGFDVQSNRKTALFPNTVDIALMLGYQLRDKVNIGGGLSYKAGLGEDVRHVSITHQGIGLRTFVDFKAARSLWMSGGFEMNYKAAFRMIPLLQDRVAWQKSGLLGVSKIISIKSKHLKKAKFQILWDFLSYQQIPRTKPLLFRVGYGLN